mmetsp:Transcript_17548/g.40829  ORF Transcript_17548/g.40829 Transcript_17548/m.40829 type:complete len:165 (+) Transcript_17548:109-603(+)|eukprot:CAMPEP_0178419740 /NCGR_PEP_ID=MMETSP0689_2-20121128/25766_1 /TAXON_ID=160604 /ORGANISM="Amphidinium massartii, Strain CS-259" /LENGTH=164 /DNA_ID=CAMNT_0020041187 /DNA_START=79 /DNA_END=573 /DNA_ORIENTATION=-
MGTFFGEGNADLDDDMMQQVGIANLMSQQAPAPHVTQHQFRAWAEESDYSEKYCDDVYEYRRVTVRRELLQLFPPGRTMSEEEWRMFGITMSRGWEHYDHHQPEANVLLFRRVLGTDPKTGAVPPAMQQKVEERKRYIAELEFFRHQQILEQQRRMEQPVPDMF